MLSTLTLPAAGWYGSCMSTPAWAASLHGLVGRRLQKLRHGASPVPLTQNQLADRTGGVLSRSSIASLERGLQGMSLVQLYVLAQALGVEPRELLPEREELAPTEPKVDELLRSATPRIAEFISRVRERESPKRGGRRA